MIIITPNNNNDNSNNNNNNNPKKCNVIHVRRGEQVKDATDLELGEATLVKILEAGSSYKFLGVKESTL